MAGGGAGFPLIDMNPENCVDEELPLATWTPVEVGEAVCPEWFVYHTNQTGDWEIFRYGDLPGNPDADVNLSKGIGEVYDIGPTRSPDSAGSRSRPTAMATGKSTSRRPTASSSSA